jgi:hypothetical protein
MNSTKTGSAAKTATLAAFEADTNFRRIVQETMNPGNSCVESTEFCGHATKQSIRTLEIMSVE